MKPLVAICQPCASLRAPHRGAVKAFLRPTNRGTDRIEIEQGSSMLPRVFNHILSEAMNHRRRYPVTHIAMLHDDVAPDKVPNSSNFDWLDIAMDELETTGADMVSAAIPIKDGHGNTSTAVDNPLDPWYVRRITLKELFALPETFEAKDVPWNTAGAPLLPNTGLWVARFDKEQTWPEKFVDTLRSPEGQSGFRFMNRITQAANGDYVGQDFPEDWLFGRFMASIGCKCVVTRKVKLEHENKQFHNRSPWGDWPTDMGFLEYQRLLNQRPSQSGEWVFPADVEGWLSETEGRALAALALNKNVLEIGSYCGKSTICLAQSAKRVVAVDSFKGTGTTTPGRETLTTFLENVSRYGVFAKICTWQGMSHMVVPDLTEQFEMAFIDGSHDKDSVLRDAAVASKKLVPGGLLAFHDYHSVDPGVMAAVDELVAGGAKFVDLSGSLAVIQPMEQAA